MIQVDLMSYELLQAAVVGVARHIKALSRQQPDSYGFDGETGWQAHIEGACGELAVAKCLGLYWSGSIDTFKVGGDVGKLQVRTRSKQYYDLIVRPDDRSADIFILVTGRAPTFQIHGWIVGTEAKKPEFLQTYGGRPEAYFVDKDHLHSIEALKVHLQSDKPKKGNEE